jgi:predicted nucleotidyltransferase
MNKHDILKNIGISEERLAGLAKKYHVKRLSVFGSYARGEQNTKSDIDFLVEWDGKPNFDRLMGLYCDLEEETKQDVDVISTTIPNQIIVKNAQSHAVEILP